MHVVAQASAIRRIVIRAKYFDMIATTRGRIEHERDEVRLWLVVFTDCAVLCCASGVKVTKSSEAEAVSMSKRFEAIFHIELGLSVGVDRRLC